MKPFKIHDMIKAVKEKRIIEAFGAGTAAIVCPVQSFNYEGETFQIPIEADKGAGKLTQRALKMMTDLQYGVVSRPDWQLPVCKA